jgi:hypothetical protein
MIRRGLGMALLWGLALGISIVGSPVWADVTRAVVESGKRATALVETREATGSAFCIDASGVFVTNQHVVGGENRVKLILNSGEQDQKVVDATVVERDAKLDIALLQAAGAGPWPSIPLAPNDDALIETMPLVVFGFPLGKDLAVEEGRNPSITVSTGRVTALRKDRGVLVGIQTDASVTHGNSGGPVLDEQGRVVGIIDAGIEGAGINIAIPVDLLRLMLLRPRITLTSGVISRARMHDANTLRFQIAPWNGRHEDYQVTITLDPGSDNARPIPMQSAGGNIYTVTLVPLPKQHASARAPHYEIVARAQNRIVAEQAGVLEIERDPNLPAGETPQTVLPDPQAAGQAKGPLSFQAPIAITVPGMKLFSSLRLADLDGDGHLDMLVIAGNDLVVLYGHGDGKTFDMIRYPMPEGGSQICVADLNHDGRLDVVVAGGHGAHVFLSAGPRRFAPVRTYQTGEGACSVAVGDFNGDGHPDLAVVNIGSTNFAVLLNQGDGAFGPPKTFPLPQYPVSVVTADFNQDGKLDLAVNCFYRNSTLIFLGDGKGGFQQSGPEPETGGGQLAVADFSRNGHPDLVGLNYWSGGLGVGVGDGQARFAVTRYGTIQYPSQICAADVDRDGRPDIVVGHQGTNQFAVYLNEGNGTMSEGLTFTVPEGDVHSAVAGDLNEDGQPDIVADGGGERLYIFLNSARSVSHH